MGENAKRLSDGEVVKIGTCEDMYYLRWDERNLVERVPNSLDPLFIGLRYRVPWPDEADLEPGEIHGSYARTERLYRMVADPMGRNWPEDLPADEEMIANPGSLQFVHKAGIVLSLPCYHGAKLPDIGPGGRIGWNGKNWSIGLRAIKSTAVGPRPVISCQHCERMWSCEWEDVLPYVNDPALLETLRDIARGAA